MIALAPTTSDKNVLTFSALNTFRNCPRKYKHRYIDFLRPREKVDALAFGSVIHGGLEAWYRSDADPVARYRSVLDYLDQEFPLRASDESQKAAWHLARAMFTGYAARYAEEDFEIVEVEKSFVGESLPYGLVLISHAQDKTIETRTGEYTKTQPSLPDRARGVVLGLVDMILYGDAIPRKDAAGNVTIERVIRTKPHPTYEAGDRTGRLPDILPLDYDTFVAAFHSAAPGSVPGTGTVAERTKPGSNGKAKS